MMKEAFRCPEFYNGNSGPVELSASALERVFQKRMVDKRRPELGAIEHFYSIPPRKRDDNTVRFEMDTGTRPNNICLDSFKIGMGEARKVPDLSYFKRSIVIFKPCQAYLAEGNNEDQLDWYDRWQAMPELDNPAIIRGFHYLDEPVTRYFGGLERCLQAPGWKVERFCEGVLIQLVDGLFDTSNPEHRQIQKKAMQYFGLWGAAYLRARNDDRVREE